jgi:hypothetical protein
MPGAGPGFSPGKFFLSVRNFDCLPGNVVIVSGKTEDIFRVVLAIRQNQKK